MSNKTAAVNNSDLSHSVWVLISSALIWICIPGIGLFYSGMGKRKSALSFLWLSLMAVSVTSIQWFLFGYSLCFSDEGSAMIGDFSHIFSGNIFDRPALGANRIPEVELYFFELMFAATASTVVIGSVAERGKVFPTIVFIFVWSSFVYDFLVRWIWSPHGWALKMGALDFAGGVPVHVCAGTSSLVYSFFLGRRKPVERPSDNRPHNLNNVFIGTALSWFGWFGFNGGSSLLISSRAVLACVVTNLAASTGGLTWCFLDYFLSKPKHKFSLFSFCMGAMAALVCITPAAGFIKIPSALVFGIFGSFCVYFARRIKNLLNIDDAFDIFAQHGIGGFIGTILTGLFAERSVPESEQIEIKGGWLNSNWIQVVHQLAFAGAGFVWSFVVTSVILIVFKLIPQLSVRVTNQTEENGVDSEYFNEFTHDYIEFDRRPENLCLPVTTIEQQNNLKMNEIKRNIVKTDVW